jgi:quercetin dioxygenase-like cupin family protein
MTHDDLVQTARAAASGDAWRGVARHDPDERTFGLLHRDAEHEVWVVCWMPGHDTGFHDHDGSAASIVVVAGEIVEERLGLSGAASARYAAGDEVVVPAAAIHRVQHAGTGPATTIHVYSPPLARMGRYAVAEDGVLERHPAPAGEALAPVGASAARI